MKNIYEDTRRDNKTRCYDNELCYVPSRINIILRERHMIEDNTISINSSLPKKDKTTLKQLIPKAL